VPGRHGVRTRSHFAISRFAVTGGGPLNLIAKNDPYQSFHRCGASHRSPMSAARGRVGSIKRFGMSTVFPGRTAGLFSCSSAPATSQRVRRAGLWRPRGAMT
jgi:hypothetical protein